jgi:mannose-6-phosphate isomerase-like protein (cupin superfamily)
MEKPNLQELEPFLTTDGSTIRAPGTAHTLWNTRAEPPVLLCCCAPAYSDADTVMTGG